MGQVVSPVPIVDPLDDPERDGQRTTTAVVLVIDDEPAMRLLHASNLEAAGILVLTAADGPAAVRLARSEQPDLAIVDVSLPGMDGFKVAEELSADSRTCEIRLLFVSGVTGAENEARAAALGAVGYVNKPFDPDALVGLVLKALMVEPEHVARPLNACAA
jgi:CheY-like chemotaxis protein